MSGKSKNQKDIFKSKGRWSTSPAELVGLLTCPLDNLLGEFIREATFEVLVEVSSKDSYVQKEVSSLNI